MKIILVVNLNKCYTNYSSNLKFYAGNKTVSIHQYQEVGSAQNFQYFHIGDP